MAQAHTLVDNFNDNAWDTTRWSVYGWEVREENGRVEIRALPSNWCTCYMSVAPYDLTGSETRVELVQAPRQAVGVQAFLLLETNSAGTIFGAYQLLIGVENGMLFCRHASGSGYAPLREVVYDPAGNQDGSRVWVETDASITTL